REWFVCCAWRGRTVLGMPSRAVDEAWTEFIGDSPSYTEFSEEAFGGHLDQLPDEVRSKPTDDHFAHTVAAWDRSQEGRGVRESVLWDLDRHLGIADPYSLSGEKMALVRSRVAEKPEHAWAFPPGGSLWLWGGSD